MKEQYALLIEVDGKAYEAFDLCWTFVHSAFLLKIQEKINRREPFAVHYVDDLEEFERQFREEIS